MRFSGGGSSRIFLFRDLQTEFSVSGALLGPFRFFYFPEGGGPGPPGQYKENMSRKRTRIIAASNIILATGMKSKKNNMRSCCVRT